MISNKSIYKNIIKLIFLLMCLSPLTGYAANIDPWHVNLLNNLTHPDIAYILLLIAIYGLFFEFTNPGYILPGLVGTISLLLAIYAFQTLPISYTGLTLIIVGIGFMLAEAFIPAFGIMGILGIIAFFFGSFLLFDAKLTTQHISLSIILTLTILTAVFFLLVINMALRARFRPITTGSEQLLHSEGKVLVQDGKMLIRTHGELWQIKSQHHLQSGQTVKVIGREGMVLIVEPKEKI